MKRIHHTLTKATLFALGLSSIAQAQDDSSLITNGVICPLIFDAVHGGEWRNLSPTINDVAVCSNFTMTQAGLA